MGLVQSIVKTIRSIRQEYNLTKAKPEGSISVGVVYIVCVPLERSGSEDHPDRDASKGIPCKDSSVP